MKKLRIFSILFLLLSAAAFVAFRQYRRWNSDTTAPVITCDSQELSLSASATEEDLLQGVTASDDISGDVSDTLVVESLSSFTSEGSRIITYAAVDDSHNVGRAERTLVYTDYQEPVFHLTAPLSYAVGEKVSPLSAITAESVLDGDLTEQIKYSMESSVNNMVVGNYPITFRVMDSGGKTVYLETQVEIYEQSYKGIQVSISDYLIYLNQGQYFDPAAYYLGADAEGELSIWSNVNTQETGSYYVDYVVNGYGAAGKNRMIVVVR